MNTYQAIMAAANTVEQHPELYSLQCNYVPACGTPGCLLGWIGHHLGFVGTDVHDQTWDALGLERHPSGMHLKALTSMGFWEFPGHSENNVTNSGADAAIFLRHFAQRYKPTPLPFVDLPAAVRAIFDREFAVSQS